MLRPGVFPPTLAQILLYHSARWWPRSFARMLREPGRPSACQPGVWGGTIAWSDGVWIALLEALGEPAGPETPHTSRASAAAAATPRLTPVASAAKSSKAAVRPSAGMAWVASSRAAYPTARHHESTRFRREPAAPKNPARVARHPSVPNAPRCIHRSDRGTGPTMRRRGQCVAVARSRMYARSQTRLIRGASRLESRRGTPRLSAHSQAG